MRNKDTILLEQAYNQTRDIASHQRILKEDFGKALQAYSHSGSENNTTLQLANMFSQAFGMIGGIFGASSQGDGGKSTITLDRAKQIRNQIDQAIQGNKRLTFNVGGGLEKDAKPGLISMLAKLDTSIKQAEDTAQAYSEAGFFGKLFKSKGDSVQRVEATPDEAASMDSVR